MIDLLTLLADLRGHLYLQLDDEINKLLPTPTTIEEKRMNRPERLARIDPGVMANSPIPRIMKLIEQVDEYLFNLPFTV